MNRLLRAIASNYIVLAVQAAYLLVLTPLVISTDGTLVFGRWSLILAIAGYLRLLDLGVGPTTARFVATAPDGEELSSVVSTSVGLLAWVGGAGTVVAAVLIGVAVSGPDTGGFTLALAIMIASRSVQLPLAVGGYVLYGSDRIVQRNGFAALRTLASLVAVGVAVLGRAGLAGFVLAGACAEIAVLVCQAWFVRSTVPTLRLSLRHVWGPRLQAMSRFTAGMIVLSLTSQLIVNSDTVVVGAFLGTATVAVYAIAMRAIEGASMLLNQISDVFLPRFARDHVTGTAAGSGETVRVATRSTICVAFTVIGTFVAFGQQLIAVWVGPGFGRAWIPLLLLSGGLAFNAPLRFAVIWAIAGDRHGRIARLAIIEAVVNIALTIALVNPFGIRGVAAASLATFAVWNGCLVPRRVFPELGLDWVSDFIRPIAVAALITIPLAAGVRAVVVSASASSVVIVVCAAAWSALELAALWRILLRRTERVALRRALGPAFVRR